MAGVRHCSGTTDQGRAHCGLLTIQQSLGWEHYEVHEPEPHILLFKYA